MPAAGWDGYVPNGDQYDYAVFTIPNATTDYDVKANQAALFNFIKVARGIVIKTDQPISLKFNSTGYPPIPLTTAQAPFEFLGKIFMRNCYITNNSGSTVNVEVMLV